MTQPANDSGRLYWIDFIRVVAIFLVVVIHVAADLLYDWGKVPFSAWMTGNIYDSIARVSVPLLFMVSGALLLGKNEPMKDFFLKRAMKLAIPFIVWSLVYLFWRCVVNESACTNKIILRLFLLDGTYYHLWFLYALIGVYLITPLLRPIAASAPRSVLWYFMALWLFFQPGMTLLEQAWDLRIGVSVPMATGFIGYFILGYLLSEVSLSPRSIWIAFIVWLTGAFATAAGTYLMSLQVGEFSEFFYQYLSLNVMLASAGSFLLLKSLSGHKSLAHPVTLNLVKKAAAASFGIYLIHVLVLDIIGGHIPLIHFNVEMGSPLWSIPLASVIAFVASFCAVYILQKIPFVNRIVP